MGLANIQNKKIEVELDKKNVYFFYNMGAAAKLSEAFGGVAKAQEAFNSACFKKENGRFVPKTADELLTKEFFDTVKIFMDSMLSHYYLKGGEYINFLALDVNELGDVVSGIIQAMGVASPDAKESDKQETPPQP